MPCVFVEEVDDDGVGLRSAEDAVAFHLDEILIDLTEHLVCAAKFQYLLLFFQLIDFLVGCFLERVGRVGQEPLCRIVIQLSHETVAGIPANVIVIEAVSGALPLRPTDRPDV
jgi:hypothetical protein